MNLTIEYPFLLDNQWHSIDLQRLNTSFLLHIDNHIIQQRVYINSFNSSLFSTIWIIFHGNKQIKIEDIRLYDQSIYSRLSKSHLKTRIRKPLNTISFDHSQHSYLEIQLNEILCQDCQLNTFDFQFRTIDSNGLLLFAKIQLSKNSSSEYLIIKLVNGHLHLAILNQSLTELHQIQTNFPLNDNDWHHLSFSRASDYHFELLIDSNEYFLFTPIHFLDKIYFGRSINNQLTNSLSTIKACLASLTINSHSINLREYIKSNSQIRNECFLDSQCPLKQCLNTGTCEERMKCNCEHTSFQGRFCSNYKLGYSFNNSIPGLIFDQPFSKEKIVSNYRISFGLITKLNLSDLIRINDQISIEIYSGLIRIKFSGNEYITNNQLVNDGFYHLVQIEYNSTGFVYLNVDNKGISKKLKNKISFDKPLLLLIGQNPVFKNPFQGQLYGLQSDIYSIFDLISPTFQRISFAPIRNKTFSSSGISPIIYPTENQDELMISSCSYHPYDDICIISSDTNSSILSFSNRTLQSTSISRYSKKILNSTLSSQEIFFHSSNSTNHYAIPPLIVSIRTPNDYRFFDNFPWRNLFIYIFPIVIGSIFCLILTICCCLKYRRKDAGVYELVETQRFRPLVVQLPSSSGENIEERIEPTTKLSKFKPHSRRKRKKSPLIETEEQREFYI